MKKVYSILFMLMGLVMYSQEIIRPASTYYSADSIKDRTDITRAIMDGVKNWVESNFIEMELPIYQPVLKLRLPKINITGAKLEYYIDTVEYADAVVYKDQNTAKYGGWFNLRKYYHKYGNEIYLVDMVELPEQPARYVLDTVSYQDSLTVSRRYFFTNHWLFSKREHDNIDSLKVTEFTPFGFNPGYAVIEGDTVRRHSQSFTKKYYQVRSLDTVFNTIDTLAIYGNHLYKP